jgi:hypothetical protein
VAGIALLVSALSHPHDTASALPGALALLAAALIFLGTWLGAVVSASRLKSKTWFIVLLVTFFATSAVVPAILVPIYFVSRPAIPASERG